MIDLLKALADENRLRILNLLMHAELCVCEIETILMMSQSNTSRHLTKLKANKVIESTKDAQWVHYMLSKTFKENYQGILGDLKTFMDHELVFQEDLKRYQNYVDQALNCTDIRNDAVKVLSLIK